MKLTFRIIPIMILFCVSAGQAQMFDKYLLPFAQFSGIPGALGSVWKGELTVYNASSSAVDIRSRFCGPNVFSGCSDGAYTIPGRSAVQPPISGAPGVFIFVPTDATLSLQFRVQDTSRESQTWGTTIPIVRATDFRPIVRLINIPTDGRFRTNLRIYADGTNVSQAVVHVFRMSDSTTIAAMPVALQRSTTAADQNDPSYAELNPISSDMTAPFVGIEVDATSELDRLWAFVSVTNNETQHVTVITP